MIYRFIMISDEVDGFKREFQLNSDDNFYSLHQQIIQSVNFKDGEMASFFICGSNWEKGQEITLVEMDTDSDQDSYIMSKTPLDEFMEDEKQRLIYTFDYLSERNFFMELREIIPGKNVEGPLCTQSVGEAPIQFVIEEEEAAIITTTNNLFDDAAEEFYGDEADLAGLLDGYENEDGDKDIDDLEEEIPDDADLL